MQYSGSELANLGRNVATPCYISLLGENAEEQLELLEILRILPGKRITAVARYRNQKVVAKLFFHPQHWQRNLKRDLTGMRQFEAHELATPSILRQGRIQGGGIILIRYLENGTSLADCFSQENSLCEKTADRALEKVFQTLARCHNVGLWQGDMHLGNYMFYQDEIYLLDGGDVKQLATPISNLKRIHNIADFISLFSVAFDSKIDFLLECYQEKFTDFSSGELNQVRALVKKIRNSRLSHYEQKVFRSTTANRKVKTTRKRYVYDRSLQSDDLERFIEAPDSFIETGQLLKDGDSTTVAEVKINGVGLVLKRYNITSFWHGFKRLFQHSRAHKCWRNASVLQILGIKTPKPCLFMEERMFWVFRRRAYFLTEQIESNNLLLQLDDDGEQIDDNDLVAAFTHFFEVMHDYQISHGDMKATNFIFRDGELYVLDLDGMRRHRFKWRFARKSLKDIKRFERNWTGSRFESVFAPMIKQFYDNRRESQHG